jgi:hypothetical protein
VKNSKGDGNLQKDTIQYLAMMKLEHQSKGLVLMT